MIAFSLIFSDFIVSSAAYSSENCSRVGNVKPLELSAPTSAYIDLDFADV